MTTRGAPGGFLPSSPGQRPVGGLANSTAFRPSFEKLITPLRPSCTSTALELARRYPVDAGFSRRSLLRTFPDYTSVLPFSGFMLSEKEYAARSATVNAKYDEKIRQCQTSFLALKISLTRDMGRDEVGLYLQRMTKLNFKEDAEMLKIEFDREEEQRDLAKKAGARTCRPAPERGLR